MANNYIQTSFYFRCGTEDNAAKVNGWISGERITDELKQDMIAASPDCYSADGELQYTVIDSCQRDGDQVWIAMEEGGDLELLATILQYAMDTLPEVEDRQGFQWAETCSKPRVDEFGGGACFIARGQPTKWLFTGQWLAQQVESPTALTDGEWY